MSRVYEHHRPRGLAPWRPQAKSRALVSQVEAVLDEYEQFLPLTIRQVYYRLVGAFGYEKTERGYERLCEMLNRARRAGQSGTSWTPLLVRTRLLALSINQGTKPS